MQQKTLRTRTVEINETQLFRAVGMLGNEKTNAIGFLLLKDTFEQVRTRRRTSIKISDIPDGGRRIVVSANTQFSRRFEKEFILKLDVVGNRVTVWDNSIYYVGWSMNFFMPRNTKPIVDEIKSAIIAVGDNFDVGIRFTKQAGNAKPPQLFEMNERMN